MHRISENDLFPSIESEGINDETLKKSDDITGELTSKESKDRDVKTPDCHTSPYVAYIECEELITKYNKMVQFSRLTGNTNLEGKSYLSLGCVHYVSGDYEKSIDIFEKAAELGKVIENKEMENRAYTNLAIVFETVGQHDKSRYYRKKALNLIGANEYTDPWQQGAFYNKQGMLYHFIGEYTKSIRCHEKSLDLSKLLHDQQGEGTSHYNLGNVYCTFGHYTKAIEHHQKSLKIRNAIGDRHGQGMSCTQIAYLYYILKEYEKSIEYQEMALRISLEIGVREMETASYNNLGRVHQAHGHFETSVTFYEKWLHSIHSFVDKTRERRIFRHLSRLLHDLGRHESARRYQERAFSIDEEKTSGCLQEDNFEIMEVMEGDENDRFLISSTVRSHTSRLKTSGYLWECIEKHEQERLGLNDEDKVPFDEQIVVLYKAYALQHAFLRETDVALFALEQCRARALVDLIKKTYELQTARSNTTSVRIHINTISSLIEKQKCCFLFMAFLMKNLASWFIAKTGKISFKPYSEPDHLIKSTEDLLKTLSEEMMETIKTEEEEDMGSSEEGDRKREKKRDLCLRRLYNAIIAPVANLIEGPEIIIVPEGEMFLIPFAALRDANGVCLSESLRIRLIPSLTTLKLIQDSPANYHCELTGALIVGDPTVDVEEIPPLPAARDEVKMISNMLGVPCLVGEQATKEAVLLKIEEVSLVHIAANGNKERGEPALALSPSFTWEREPELKDFVLTIEDIARLTIRAELVVLSTCYGGCGKVMKGEGVVGIARAFLGSGARSVLMSLWSVNDKATRTFMYTFYNCLKFEKMSASEALHWTQTEMRSRLGFKDEQDWAAFELFGDDVTIDL